MERRKVALRTFREKWGNHPPRTDGQWRDFWLELMRVEDGMDALRRDAQVVVNELTRLSAESLEIFDHNQLRVPATDHVQALEAITRRAQAALKRQIDG